MLSSVFIINFEHNRDTYLLFLLLNLNMYLPSAVKYIVFSDTETTEEIWNQFLPRNAVVV